MQIGKGRDYRETDDNASVLNLSGRELTSRGPSPLRAWKGYNFDVLNDLTEKGYISGSRRAKSVYIEDKCIEEAKELLKEYFDFEEET